MSKTVDSLVRCEVYFDEEEQSAMDWLLENGAVVAGEEDYFGTLLPRVILPNGDEVLCDGQYYWDILAPRLLPQSPALAAEQWEPGAH